MVWRVRDRASFEALRRSARRARRGAVTVSFAEVGAEGRPRVAFAIGKRAGGAVERNRLRRRLRAVAAGLGNDLEPGVYLLSAGRTATGLTYPELKSQVTEAMTAAPQARPR
jgi:ribonuclease P protein component